MLISVVITTYNRPLALKMALLALSNQTDSNFEVIVADDGSREETRLMIESVKPILGYSLTHVWQEDKGFRAARVRNLAALEAKGEYLVFLDGDCVPRANFIKNHRKLSEKGWIVAGNRLLLSQVLTEKVELDAEPIHEWSIGRWIGCYVNGEINRLLPLMSFAGINTGRKSKPNSWKKVRTCNLGVWRQDFNAVNGFDCAYEGWGFEDSDLAIRLLNFGVCKKNGSYATGVLHMWHKEFDRGHEVENYNRLQSRLDSGDIRATIGLEELQFKPGL